MGQENQLVRDKPDREHFLDLIADGVQMHKAAMLAGYSNKYEARRLIRENAQVLQSKLWERLAERAGQAIDVLGGILDADSDQTRYIGARDILDRLGFTQAATIDVRVHQDHETLRRELEGELGEDMVERIARRAQGLPDEICIPATDLNTSDNVSTTRENEIQAVEVAPRIPGQSEKMTPHV